MVKKEIILIGDKVLIEPLADNKKTDGGLYLPQGVKEKEKVQYGKIVRIGPGYPIIDPSMMNQEPWAESKSQQYFPLQACIGDECIYLRDQGFEVVYEKKKYYVIPHAAILILIRDNTKIGGVSL